MNIISSTVTSLKSKLLALPKSTFRIVIGSIVAVVLAIVFFIIRDVLHIFDKVKEKITK